MKNNLAKKIIYKINQKKIIHLKSKTCKNEKTQK